jgi:hypothetical protein
MISQIYLIISKNQNEKRCLSTKQGNLENAMNWEVPTYACLLRVQFGNGDVMKNPENKVVMSAVAVKYSLCLRSVGDRA